MTDTEDDGRDVTASIALDVAGARDPVASVESDTVVGGTAPSSGQRVDEQLAADARSLGRGDIADGLTWALQRFAAPVFYGEQLTDVWGVPAFLASWLRTASGDQPG